jgi:hypothetical protein
MTKHCFNCGHKWILATAPGRRDTCEDCDTDFRCCRNCIHHDPVVAHQCRERRAEPVQEKDRANYCEYFDFSKRTFKKPIPNQGDISREDTARDALKKLLGD